MAAEAAAAAVYIAAQKKAEIRQVYHDLAGVACSHAGCQKRYRLEI